MMECRWRTMPGLWMAAAFRLACWWAVSASLLSGCWAYVDKDAQQEFRARRGEVSITVFPVRVVRAPGNPGGGSADVRAGKPATVENDAVLGRSLADFLRTRPVKRVEFASEPIEFPVEWSVNEAKVAQRSARLFARGVAARRLDSDYALLGEIICNADESHVLGVHFYLSDAHGVIADGRIGNSHFRAFAEVRPKNREDGLRVLKLMLDGRPER